MITKRGKGDYPNVYRPCRISEIYGQEEAKMIIGNGLDGGTLANSLLFYGVSGTGKTSIARIIAMGVNCEKGPTSEPCSECKTCRCVRQGGDFAFQEFNSAHFTGIDHLRKEAGNFVYAPLIGDKKIVVFDECHRLSKNAQDLLLKTVEDSGSDVHFILCSTEPEGIIKTLRNRCLPIEFERVLPEEIKRLLLDVCNWEGVEPVNEVIDAIVEESEGMPRNALFLLQKAVYSGNLEESVDLIEPAMELVMSGFDSMRE